MRILAPKFMPLAGALALLPGLLLSASTPLAAQAGDGESGSVPPEKPAHSSRVLIVVGAPGLEEFGKNFHAWAESLTNTCKTAGANYSVIGLAPEDPDRPDREQLAALLEAEPRSSDRELYLILLGHGTFDRREAKFNVRGPDFNAKELAAWLEPFKRPVAVINASSASGPFIDRLSAPGRVVITATKSGNEINYSRFGGHFAANLSNPEADLDKDGQTSLLEAWLMASRQVAEFYQTEGRLATEHALLDDNGDKLGTPADWFRGIRATKKAKGGKSLDGHRAHQFHLVLSEQEQRLTPEQRARRNELELEVIDLRERKSDFQEDEYYHQLEGLLLKLARLYEQMEKEESPAKKPDS